MNLETLDNFCAATEHYSQSPDDAFVWEQMGDPRFNMLYWITDRTPSAGLVECWLTQNLAAT